MYSLMMNPTLSDLIGGIQPVTLSDEYLRMIEEVESAPENQSGSDKTWVWEAEVQDAHERLCAMAQMTIAVRPLARR